jgi:hypothetical protein
VTEKRLNIKLKQIAKVALQPTLHSRTLGLDSYFCIILSLLGIGSGWTIFSQLFILTSTSNQCAA